MKRSEVIQELLDSYCFQYGKRVDYEVIYKARKIIENYKKEESKSNKTSDLIHNKKEVIRMIKEITIKQKIFDKDILKKGQTLLCKWRDNLDKEWEVEFESVIYSISDTKLIVHNYDKEYQSDEYTAIFVDKINDGFWSIEIIKNT